MKKLSIVLLSVLLLIVFVGCDLSVETMGKMGKNLAGTDKKYVANIIKQTAPEAAVIKTEGDTKTIAGSNFSISAKDSEGSIKVGNQKLELPEKLSNAIGGVLNESSFESIILPTDISDIVLGVKSGSNSKIIKEELKKDAEGDSLKAAKGTVALVGAILDGMKDPGEPENEGFNKVLNDINNFLPQEDSITNGDVVVLTALTNIVFNQNVLSNVGIIMNQPAENASEQEKETYNSAMTEVTGEMMNQFSSLLDVVTNVPSGISDKINIFINDLMDDSDNKEESK